MVRETLVRGLFASIGSNRILAYAHLQIKMCILSINSHAPPLPFNWHAIFNYHLYRCHIIYWMRIQLLTGITSRLSHLRNKFHCSSVHGSMNATTGHAQSKWLPKDVTLRLHGSRSVHTSMNIRKMKCIPYIYTLFLHRFCSLFVKSWFKSYLKL